MPQQPCIEPSEADAGNQCQPGSDPVAVEYPPVALQPGHTLLYQVLSGSHATGLVTETSDFDWRGVYQAPTVAFLGLTQPKETIEIEPDQTYWELGHFARLCLRGNPNIMELLWIDERVTSPVMEEIRAMRTSFFTTSMVAAYLGWVTKERRILANPEYEDKLTSKRGSHLVRLLLTLQDTFTTGQLHVVLADKERDLCMAIKRGEKSKTEVLYTLDMLKERCIILAADSGWPKPDPQPLEDIVIRARRNAI
jgi:hypothetical protein